MGSRFVGPTKPIAVAIALVVGGATESYGFTPTVSRQQLSQPRHQDSGLVRSIVPSHSSPSALPALVYGTDGTVVGDDVFDNPDEKARRASQDNDALLDALKASVGDPLVWSKIACAFAPPPHDRLTPGVVTDAFPVGLSSNGIDIAVAVPASVEGGAANAAANQLVRVLVKVGFPQAWAVPQDDSANHTETVAALVGQVRILEGHAGDRLSQRTSSGPSKTDPRYYEKLVVEQRWMERLQEEPSSEKDLPEWWTSIDPPFSTLELADEAKLLKGLLNEDEFEDELRALFVRHCNSKSKNNSDPLVLRAAVASIGSSGLFLKARVAGAKTTATVHGNDGDGDDGDDDEAEMVATAAVPYATPPRETKTVGELREGVLLLVESVDPMPMPIQPQAKPVSAQSEGETITPFNEQVMEMVNELEEKAATSDGTEKDAGKESAETKEDEGDDVDLAEAKAIAPDEPSAVSKISPAVSRTQQPKPPDEEAKLAAKYAAIEDLGERAFAILRDLGMV